MYQEDEERVRARAQQIWEREGKPEGRADIHWEMAREEIAIEDNQSLATLPNPIAEGRQSAEPGDGAEPITAAEESFGDSGPSAQGERTPYPYASNEQPKARSKTRS